MAKNFSFTVAMYIVVPEQYSLFDEKCENEQVSGGEGRGGEEIFQGEFPRWLASSKSSTISSQKTPIITHPIPPNK